MSAGRIQQLEKMLIHLEGRSFGKRFEFATFGYSDQLHTAVLGNGWTELDLFSSVEGMREFAKELNAAIQPVVDKFVKVVKQELANECTRLAAKELNTISNGVQS